VNDSKRVNRDVNKARMMPFQGPGRSGVVNGVELSANSKDSKLAVLLLMTRGSSLNACTGILISKQIILTAAHCVSGVQPKQIRIVFKNHGTQDEAPSDFKADKIVIHEKFTGSPEGFSDLALVKMLGSAPSDYPSVSLMSANEQPDSDVVTLIGYGITSEDKKDSMVLRETTKSFKSDIHPKIGYFGIDQSSKSGGFCRGDSGAPVFVSVKATRKLFGINSFTVGLEANKECHTASVAMSAAAYSSWITDHASKL
jgi:secreted trypsin-like serine protease